MPRLPLLADGRHSALQVSPVPLPQLPVPLNPHSGRLEELHLDSLSGSLFIWKNGDNNSTYLHSVLER